ncbi:unnamed protein product [Fusarium graminearum]|uniref:Chromosome 3, complete genome n=2 Tax=Gibberella zeae TaxID=5518 RepID=I1RLS6_GIBZE|nr:hypothetical protein FGSG_04895 [Fusarium graminearum PH-1]EYB21522.1 hypothetical protein FG05_04895 [Fusarium graminearum]ESU10788.1 hypothetical protein FGSG_04895 [Fusarium graminearum PH-1]CAF3517621.1 unnamed protein product [Fusarium graminearum]CAF3572507.1 unnamed protein product [Fusarium graminearum]CAG1967021.1 unnamed protein product [Fusarium graminearum]|eukprot:XP_011323364.1 hypothetical protein FGSG_04895 [Fusarium graminearum PH-1]
MHFSKISTALVALAVGVPGVVATPSPNLDARGVKTRPVVKPPVFVGPPVPATVVQETQAKTTEKQSQPTQTTIIKTPVTAEKYKGFASYYYQGESPGKCGQVYRDGELVAALDKRRFDMSLCGKKIYIQTPAQRWVEVTVVDSTDGGIDENYLDLSVAAFKVLARIEDGVSQITWNYI